MLARRDNAPDGRVLGEYGTSATDVKAEFIWLSPEVGDTSAFGGDDGLGGYMPLAVAANDNANVVQLYWVHANHMGVPALYTDASGAAIPPPTGYSAPGFPGQSRTLADLYYNRYRDYDPTTGRYIQADPIGLAGGASPYSYARNNPLRYTDPSGQVAFAPAAGFGLGGGAAGTGGLMAFCGTPIGWAVCGGAVAGAAAALIWYNWDDYDAVRLGPPLCPPLLLKKSGNGGRYGGGFGAVPASSTGDPCKQEWEDAYRMCLAELGSSYPNVGITGGHSDVHRCAKGLVSRACGGNRPDYEHDPYKPKYSRPRNWKR
jgi:RHS repeat-associated protein